MKLQIHELIYVIIIAALLIFIFKKDVPKSEYVDRLKFQNDSIIKSMNHDSEVKEQIYEHKIYSLNRALKINNKTDSLNHYKNAKEKKRVLILSVDDRKRLRDSIFRANGL